jgi:hypothetical protein
MENQEASVPLDPKNPRNDQEPAVDAGQLPGPLEKAEPKQSTAIVSGSHSPGMNIGPPEEAAETTAELPKNVAFQKMENDSAGSASPSASMPALSPALEAPSDPEFSMGPVGESIPPFIPLGAAPENPDEPTGLQQPPSPAQHDSGVAAPPDESRARSPFSSGVAAPTISPVESIVLRVESHEGQPEQATQGGALQTQSDESLALDGPTDLETLGDLDLTAGHSTGAAEDAVPLVWTDFESAPDDDQEPARLRPLPDVSTIAAQSEPARVNIVVSVQVSVAKLEKIARAAVEKATLLAERVVDQRIDVIHREQFTRDAQMRALLR